MVRSTGFSRNLHPFEVPALTGMEFLPHKCGTTNSAQKSKAATVTAADSPGRNSEIEMGSHRSRKAMTGMRQSYVQTTDGGGWGYGIHDHRLPIHEFAIEKDYQYTKMSVHRFDIPLEYLFAGDHSD